MTESLIKDGATCRKDEHLSKSGKGEFLWIEEWNRFGGIKLYRCGLLPNLKPHIAIIGTRFTNNL